MNSPRRFSALSCAALLALSACQGGLPEEGGADGRVSGDQSLGFDGKDDGIISSCSGIKCDHWYARSLTAELWDKPSQGIKFAAEAIGSCFPHGVGADWDLFQHLPNWTTAICIGVGGFAGSDILKAITKAAQDGQCLHLQTEGNTSAAGALTFKFARTDNGGNCDAAEMEWQRSHTPPDSAVTDTGLRGYFNPIPPVRMHDSRNGAGKLIGGSTRQIKVRGSGTGIPFSAVAVQLNLTSTESVASGFLRVWQCDRPMPSSSNVNFPAGQNIANSAVTAVGSGDTICVYANQSTHIIVDVTGYYDGTGAGYVPLSPYRAYDGREGGSSVLTDGLIALGSQVPATAKAVALNATVTDSIGGGFLTVYPGYSSMPPTSTSNFRAGQTIAAASSVGVNYQSVAYHLNTPAHVILDVAGYFAKDIGAKMAPVVPARLLDTRSWAYPTPLVGGTVVSIPTNLSGRPAGTIAAVVLNITAAAPTGPGFLTAYPCNRPGGVPVVSNLNFAGGEVAIPNLATVQVDASDAVCIYTSTTTDVVVDVQGYYLY